MNKRGCAVIALIFLALTLNARAFENEPTGFRGFAWGTPVDAVRTMVGTSFNRTVDPDMVEYRSRDDLVMNGIPLQLVFYRFYKGRLSAGILQADHAHGASMLETLTARFGPPQQKAEHAFKYYWLGDRTSVGLFCDGREKLCRAVFESMALLHDRQDDLRRSGRDHPGF